MRRTGRPYASGVVASVVVSCALERIDQVVGLYPDAPASLVVALDQLWRECAAWTPRDGWEYQDTSDR